MRERLNNSDYWMIHRKAKKIISSTTMIVKELIELAWIIFGMNLYWSDKADGCSKDNRGPMLIMILFIILGILKIILFTIVVIIVIYALVQSRMKKRKEKSRSKQILRSLKNMQFSSLAATMAAEPEEECIICYMPYDESDVVT